MDRATHFVAAMVCVWSAAPLALCAQGGAPAAETPKCAPPKPASRPAVITPVVKPPAGAVYVDVHCATTPERNEERSNAGSQGNALQEQLIPPAKPERVVESLQPPAPPLSESSPHRDLAQALVVWAAMALVGLGVAVIMVSPILRSGEGFVFRRHWGGFGGESSGWNISAPLGRFVAGLLLVSLGALLAIKGPDSEPVEQAVRSQAAEPDEASAPSEGGSGEQSELDDLTAKSAQTQ